MRAYVQWYKYGEIERENNKVIWQDKIERAKNTQTEKRDWI